MTCNVILQSIDKIPVVDKGMAVSEFKRIGHPILN